MIRKNAITSNIRHFFACYSAHGEAYIKTHHMADVIAFTCSITRDNWVEINNKHAFNRGKGDVAIKVTSKFARKVMCWEKGDNFIFKPIKPDSILFVPELSTYTYYLTTVELGS
jgi:hypothetical protein